MIPQEARSGLPDRRPMASVRRVSLFQREIRMHLSSAALDILLADAAVLSEGQLEEGCYFGSTMITIDLTRVSHLVSDSCDLTTARKAGELIAKDKRFEKRARQIGAREAERLAGEPIADLQIDLRVRTNGCHLHVDMDVEASNE